ncbi:hypothetical protein MT325_m157L [Paramecium bursaria chlorella virus MT325]|uniref:Uncharacterized protein m157L n=1 Tax=Paramecium bursaria Chlorella virus MT325 TaxID=346932 RepID=A7ITN7_PBCVM|nr:hypothetical protein MT325_m157L [Paramecium bursaria chlorella virus MT325]
MLLASGAVPYEPAVSTVKAPLAPTLPSPFTVNTCAAPSLVAQSMKLNILLDALVVRRLTMSEENDAPVECKFIKLNVFKDTFDRMVPVFAALHLMAPLVPSSTLILDVLSTFP